MNIAGKDIPGVGFGVLALITLIAAYYFGSRTGKSNLVAGGSDQLAKDISKEDLSYDISQYKILADRAYTCLYGITEDEKGLYSVFSRMRNNSDVLQLIQSFGKRSGGFDFWAKSLTEWLASDLNNTEIEKVNDILKRNNITYQF